MAVSGQAKKRAQPAAAPERAAKAARTEDDDFVRGGHVAITEKDRENIKKQDGPRSLFSDATDDKAGNEGRKKQSGKAGKAGGKKASVKSDKAAVVHKQEKSAKVHFLTYKKLDIGTVLMGEVTAVDELEMTVGLPNGLSGSVPITEVCEDITRLVEKEAANEEASDSEESDEDEESVVPPMSSLFKVGDVVVCAVTRVDREKGQKKKIHLSVDPKRINKGLNKDNLLPGMVLPGTVASVEDHGYMVALGIDGMVGFAKKGDNDLALEPLQPVTCLVRGINPDARTVNIALDSEHVTAAVARKVDGKPDYTYATLSAGILVNAVVKDLLPNGLAVTFLGFTGTIDIFQLDKVVENVAELADLYPPKTKLRARILHINKATKRIGLTLAPNMVNRQPIAEPDDVQVGEIFPDVPILRVDDSLGLLFKLPKTGRYAYAHISRVSDEHLDKLSGTKNYHVGKKHTIRVVGFNAMENLVQVSCQKSVLEKQFLQYSDIKPGQLVQGTVLAVDTYGMKVAITDNIRGLVPTSHLADLTLKNPKKTLKTGQTIKCRVLSVDPTARKLLLTHKSTLVKSNLPILADLNDAEPGMIIHGVVTAVKDFGCIVTFYNNVRGLLPAVELKKLGLLADMSFGKPIKCKVVAAYPDTGKLRLSLQFTEDSAALNSVDSKLAAPAGTHVDAKVTGSTPEGLLVRLLPSNVPAFLPSYQLSDHIPHWARLHAMYAEKEGAVIKDVLVMENATSAGNSGKSILLTLKDTLKRDCATSPASLDDIREGMLMHGYVRTCTDYGVFVGFPHGLSALASLPHLSDGFVSNPAAMFQVGQSVRAKVISVDSEKGQFQVSLKQSECATPLDDTLYMTSFMAEERLLHLAALEKLSAAVKTSIKDAVAGKHLSGSVTFVKDFGVVVDLKNDLTGFATKEQSKGVECLPGMDVTACVLDMDLEKKVVDISFKPELLEAPAPKRALKAMAKAAKEDETIQGVIELVKENLLVLTLPKYPGVLAVARTKDYNDTSKPFTKFKTGQSVQAKLLSMPEGESEFVMKRPVVVLVNQPKPKEKGKQKSFNENDLNPTIRSLADCEEGMVLRAKVLKVQAAQLNLDLGHNVKGRIHITECDVRETDSGKNPLRHYKAGDVIEARVLGLHDAKTHRFLPITHSGGSKSVLELTLKPASETSPRTLDDIAVGETCTGYVQEAGTDHLWVHISPTLRGRVGQMETSEKFSVAQSLKDHFSVGSRVECSVVALDAKKGQLDLSLLPAEYEVEVDLHVCARVRKMTDNKQFLLVDLPNRAHGRVHVTDLADTYSKDLSQYKTGMVAQCVVVAKSGGNFDLSMRPSRVTEDDTAEDDVVDREIVSELDLSEGDIVRGYVKNISESGCFVSLNRTLTARVKIANLSDAFLTDWKSAFPAGTLVKGKIMSIDSAKHIEMSLKMSDIDPEKYSKKLEFTDIHEGMKLKGIVRSVEKYGVFVTIANGVGRLSGLAHVSELADDPNRAKDPSKLYKVGDDVKAYVTKVNAEKKQLSLSLKPSHFVDDSSESESEDEDEEMVDAVEADSDAASDDQSEEEEDNDDSQSEDEDEDDEGPIAGKKRKAEPLAVNVGFGWDAKFALADAAGEQNGDASGSESSDEDGEGSSGDEAEPNRPSKRAKHRKSRDEEAVIAQREKELLDDTASPQTAADFDRLLLASPNNSYLWVQYMAMHLSQTEVDKARQVAERALRTVDFRDQSERLNIWKALMNLEARFGSAEDLLKVFERSLVVNDQKKVYMHLAEVHETLDRHQDLFKLYETMTKKFGQSKKVWVAFGLAKLRNGDVEGTRAVLKRSLKSLPRRKHLMTISKFAQMEFKYGEVERGRTLFEEILSNYPKRVDLWSIYLDMEIRNGELDNIRHLFERVVSLKLSSKKMKYFFKRYLDFEKQHGNQSTVDHVKQKAREYVEAKMQM